MKPLKTILVTTTLALSLSVTGCQTPAGQNEQGGVIVGGILGGILGNQVGKGDGRTAATIVGTLLGATIGGSIGRSMDDTDRLKVAHSLETVRTGVPTSWNNPDSGTSYSVTPTKTYDTNAGPCREYVVDAIVNGQNDQVVGTACRDNEGRWVTKG